jgi:branched-chain amino acid transport system substrate-binding protein
MSALGRRGVATVAIAFALVAGACAAEDDGATGPLTVFLSAPLRGEHGADGRDIADGARLAIEQAGGRAGDDEVGLEILDATAGPTQRAGWSAPAVARNARTAAQDTSAIAYIGDFESGATRVSLPITNQAVVPQISPASTALDLVVDPENPGEPPDELQPSGERTFMRVIPDDGVQADAAAAWARELDARSVLIVEDGSAYGESIAEEFSEQVAAEGISVIAERRLPQRKPRGSWLGALRAPGAFDADLVYLAGASPDLLPELSSGVTLAIRGRPPIMLASDALLPPATRRSLDLFSSFLRFTSSAQDPEQLPPAGEDFASAFRDEYGRAPGLYAAYGYEAMALVLDAIERAGAEAEDRRAVLDVLFATSDRESVLGTYSITAVGNTTLDAIAGYRIEGGEPVFDRALAPP